jgi:hypothetical protein
MNRAFLLTVAFALTTAVAGSGCGGADSMTPDPGPSSGIGASTRIVDLTDAQGTALCDWVAGRFGGYGHGVTCTDGTTLSARQTRELCMTDYLNAPSTCTATVGDVESCTNDGVGPPTCSSVPASCFAVISCVTGIGAATAAAGD